MKKILFHLCVITGFILGPTNLFAQTTITGKVTTENGEALIGATIQEGTSDNGTFTNVDGTYSITLKDQVNAALVFSYTGYQTKVVVVADQKVINVSLVAGAVLDEVVVVGYGTVKKSDLTGAISSIKANELSKFGAISLDQALAGRAAGVVVTQSSGMPGAGAAIKIRGINSMTGSEPLYVIDGTPIDNSPAGSLSSEDEASAQITPLSMINPSDIESIEILKDASATAIYGARGSNGVVLITTKSGKSNDASYGNIRLETEYGISNIPKLIDLQDANEYWITRSTALRNFGGTVVDAKLDSAQMGLLTTTNWQEAIFQTGHTFNNNLTLSGRSEKLNYLISAGLLDAEGIVKRTDFRRLNARVNLDAQVKSWLKVGTRLYYAHVNSNQQSTNTDWNVNNGTNSIIQRALRMPSDLNLRADDTDDRVTTYSPLQALEGNIYENTLGQFLGNGFAEFTFNPNLKLKALVSYQDRSTSQRFYQLNNLPPAFSRGGWAKTGDTKVAVVTNENILTYNRRVAKGNINIVLGQSTQLVDVENVRTSNYGFANDILLYNSPQTATFYDPDQILVQQTKLLSFFGRYNHNVLGKYLFTLTGRYDGSSRFATNNKWAFFPAAAFAYKISQENFMRKIPSISDMKLRVSYGFSGNQALAPYQSLSQLAADQIAMGIGGSEALTSIYYASQLPNPNLKWETTAQFDAGLDIGFFKDRVTATLDVYQKRTTDLLVVGNRIPAQSGFTTLTENLGEMEARGIELTLDGHILSKKKLKWFATAIAARGKTRIIDMKENFIQSGYNQGWVSGGTQRLIIGEELGTFYGYQRNGISQFSDFEEFQGLSEQEQINLYNSNLTAEFTPLSGVVAVRPGEQIYIDQNGDGLINELDKTIIGHAQPDIMLSLNNTFTYGNFELSFFIDAQLGQDIANVSNFFLLAFDQQQQHDIVGQAWTPENPSSVYPRLDAANNGNPAFLFSDRYIEDGSFIRLQNVTLGYNFSPQSLQKLKIASAKVYVSGSNLYVHSDYTGYNPDVSLNGSNNLALGHDNGGYPVARTYRLGVNVMF